MLYNVLYTCTLLSDCMHLSNCTHLPTFLFRSLGVRIFQEKSLNLKLSCNEVYCTNALLLLIKILLQVLRCLVRYAEGKHLETIRDRATLFI